MSRLIRNIHGANDLWRRHALRLRSRKMIGVCLVVSLVGASATAVADDRAARESRITSLPPADFGPYDAQLRSLIELALSENPRVRSAWSGVESGYHRAPQAASLPDLQLQYRYFAESPETRVGPQKHALEISQGVPWKGKRSLQAERADLLPSRARVASVRVLDLGVVGGGAEGHGQDRAAAAQRGPAAHT